MKPTWATTEKLVDCGGVNIDALRKLELYHMNNQADNIVYWSCKDNDENLIHANREDAIEEYLDGCKTLLEEIEVHGYAKLVIDPKNQEGNVLGPYLECLDEEYGSYLDDYTVPTKAMKEAEKAFILAIIKEYSVWRCDPVATRKVSVREWIKKNRPEEAGSE